MKQIITDNKYQYHNDLWWKNRKAIIQKTYTNALGDIIEKNSIVTIGWKMETPRYNRKIHKNCFFVQDLQGIRVGGVKCLDLVLLSEVASLLEFSEN